MSLGMITNHMSRDCQPISPVSSRPFDRQQDLNYYAQQMRQQKFDSFKRRNNAEVLAHEEAHKAAGGPYAGAIHIKYDANGVATGGHVSIAMPTLNKANPQATINHADVVFRAAMAPHSPSNQDFKVAAAAMDMKSQAQQLQKKPCPPCATPLGTGNKLNFIA